VIIINTKVAFGLSILTILVGSLFLVLNLSFSFSKPQTRVGVYYYPWYPLHWNYSKEYPKWNVVDTPVSSVLGYYDCQNETAVKQQLTWMEESGIDFIVLSWWGNKDWGYGYYGDATCQFIFQVIKQYKYNITAALMVESFNGTVYDFQNIYDYVYGTYVVPYDSIYMKLDKLPILCFYNGEITKNGMVGSDNQGRFQTRIVGHSPYVDWWFAIPCTVNNSTIPPLSKKDGMICVEPRYDDQFIYRTENSTFDPSLSEGLYAKQWNEALRLARESKVNLVIIYSWNEYHERSQIEPCNDSTSYQPENTTLNLEKTRYFISQIKSKELYPMSPLVLIGSGLIVTGTLTSGYFIYKRKKFNK